MAAGKYSFNIEQGSTVKFDVAYKDSNGIERGFNIPEFTMEQVVEKIGNFKLIK